MKTIQLTIEKWANGGRGLARQAGKVWFVEGALPGEQVLAQVQKEKKDFGEASAIQILTPSADRVQPVCAHYEYCGGCSLQHLQYDKQPIARKQMCVELLYRIGKLTPEEFPPRFPDCFSVVTGSALGYRVRVRLHKSKGGWGFLSSKSNTAFTVQECPVLHECLQKNIPLQLPKHIQSNAKAQYSILGNGQTTTLHTQPITIEVCHKTIVADNSVFFQSNLELLPSLVAFVQAAAAATVNPKLAVDLYAGIGFFSVFLQDYFPKIVAVERDKNCLALAQKNVPSSVEFIRSSAEDWLKNRTLGEVSFLVVDPPRTGLDSSVVEALLQIKPQTLVYVSCNPATLARDLSRFVKPDALGKSPYKVMQIRGFDFYPQTPHLEVAVWLTTQME